MTDAVAARREALARRRAEAQGQAGPRSVSIDLQESEDNRALINAILADNPELTIRRLPGLVKLLATTEIVISRETVEKHLGRAWETGEFQLALVSYAGNFSEWDDDRIVVKWEH